MTDEKPELQEVVLVETPAETKPEENPKLQEFTAGVDMLAIGGGILGGVAVGFVPKLLKWDTGIKDIAVSAATTLLGGYLLSKWKKQAAYGFVIVGGTLTLVKGIRMLMGKSEGLFDVEDTGELIYDDDDLIYDVGEFDDDEVYTEDELFGIGQDLIVPTADVDW